MEETLLVNGTEVGTRHDRSAYGWLNWPVLLSTLASQAK